MVLCATKSNMKTGIMGGTFNPPHRAHLACAREASEACSLDRVLFVPANVPPHKSLACDIPFAIRCEMVRLCIADDPAFHVSTIEGERSGKSYSIDTLTALAKLYPHDQLYFIIGSDSFLELDLWHRYADIVRLSNLIVMERPGKEIADPLPSLPVAIRNEFRYSPESHSLHHTSGTQIFFVTGEPQAISSTEIRTMIAEGQTVSHLVPPAVEAYIVSQRIYTK